MRLSVQLNPAVAHAREDLNHELQALTHRQDTELTTKKAPPPEGALGWGEIQQFIITYQKELTEGALLVRALLQVLKAWMSRTGASDRSQPKSRKLEDKLIIVVVDGEAFGLPNSEAQEKKFLTKVTGGSGKTSSSPQPKDTKKIKKASTRSRRGTRKGES